MFYSGMFLERTLKSSRFCAEKYRSVTRSSIGTLEPCCAMPIGSGGCVSALTQTRPTMQFWRCKCGESTAFGSDPPAKCDFCEKCSTTLEGHPDHHKTERTPHKWVQSPVETDEGPKPLTRCQYCHRTKKEIEKQEDADGV